MDRRSSVLVVADFGSKTEESVVLEDSLFGIRTATDRFVVLDAVADLVAGGLETVERKWHRNVASSVQQTEDFVGTGTFAKEWGSSAERSLAGSDAFHNLTLDSRVAHSLSGPC